MSDIVTTQAVVTTAGAKLIAKIPQGQQAFVTNRDATNSIFVGPAGVTTTTGAEVKPNGSWPQGGLADLPPETEVWATCTTGTPRSDVSQIIAD